jgi:hypothetical protein
MTIARVRRSRGFPLRCECPDPAEKRSAARFPATVRQGRRSDAALFAPELLAQRVDYNFGDAVAGLVGQSASEFVGQRVLDI